MPKYWKMVFVALLVKTTNMEGSQVLCNNSTNNPSAPLNATEISRIYVFRPASFTNKLVMVILLASIGITGFVGNVLLYYFISRKKQKQSFSYIKRSPFVRNLNIYLKSLALSDMFSNIIATPLACIDIMFDVFKSTWPCRIVRFFALLFASITMNNLIVISIERYFSTRAVPRTFKVSTVRKLVFGAWIIGFIIVWGPTATFHSIRYDLNDTHYTAICKLDNSYFKFRVIFASYAVVQHIIPTIIVSYFNISVAKTMWTRHKRRIDIQRDNAIRSAIRAATFRGTYLLVAITFAFIIPSALLYYGTYVMLVQPSFDFQADFMARYLGVALFFSISIINFIIYVVQMKDFRAFLKNIICGEGNETNLLSHPNPAGNGIQLRAFVIKNNL